jgi:hypothetical protein
MTGRQLTILTLLAVYILTISGLTVYYGFNFSDYVHRMRDEIIDYTLFLLLTSILFQGLVCVILKALIGKLRFLAQL